MVKYKIMHAVIGTSWRVKGRDSDPTTEYFIRSVHETREAAYAARLPEDSVESFIAPEISETRQQVDQRWQVLKN